MSGPVSSYPLDKVSTLRRGGHRKAHQLTIMVCGRSGLGKSTFLNTLCDGSIYQKDEEHKHELPKTLEIIERTVSFKLVGGKSINVTVIDTPGFGAQLNCQNQVDKIKNHIEEKFDSVLKEESRIDRSKYLPDTRVHCCLYFIPNSGHDLEELDRQAIMELSKVVNVIPIISKSDTLMPAEVLQQKRLVRESLARDHVRYFNFADEIVDTEAENYHEMVAMHQMIPLAVSGSNIVYKVGNEFVRGREYQWGFARSDDSSFSDLTTLRDLLFSDYLQDLKEATLELYENYRTRVLMRNAQAVQKAAAAAAAAAAATNTVGPGNSMGNGTTSGPAHGTPTTMVNAGIEPSFMGIVDNSPSTGIPSISI